MKENPFTPSFGEVPVHLAGRQQLIDEITHAFDATRRRPEFTTLFSGARGTGKTTLLSLLAERAAGLGWIAVNVTALPGMLDEIEAVVHKRAAHLVDARQQVVVSEVGLPQLVSVSLERRPEPSTWRTRMEDVLDQLDGHGTGLLITVDEVDPRLDEMILLAAEYQHFVREKRKVALLMAGLPHNISMLLSDKTASFLRRAQLAHLGSIPDYEIEDALVKTIHEGGREVGREALDYAVREVRGFPFMLQLVGYRAWNVNPDADSITLDDFELGADMARREMKSRIFDATYNELSNGDVAFLSAMLQDEHESLVSDLGVRLGKSASSVSQQRRRLIDAGIIGERRRGVVAFEMPFFREYLEEYLN